MSGAALLSLLEGWKWILGSTLLVGVVVASCARRTSRAAALRDAGLLVALTASTYVARRVLSTPAFFMHTGRGPDWICAAHDARGAPYGPGQHEVFGFVVEAFAGAPDRALFEAQAALAAFVPAFVWVIARFCGARAPVAFVLALLAAADPALARVGASESYYAACIFFLFGAAAALAAGSFATSSRSPRFGAAVVAASLLLAQAVLIHPVSWLPACLVPFVVLVGPGMLRRRLEATREAFAVVVGVVVVQVGSLVAEAPRAANQNVSHHATELYLHDGLVAAPLLGLLSVGVYFYRSKRPLRTRIRAATAGIVASVLLSYQLLGLFDLPPSGSHVYAMLSVPALLAALSARSRAAARPRALAAVLLVVGGVGLAVAAPRMLELTTEAREANWWMDIRRGLPRDATVGFVHREGIATLRLPLYGGCGLPGPRAVELGADGNASTVAESIDYYYRSSLCSTTDGAGLCASVERNYRLRVVAEASFPALSHKVQLQRRGFGFPRVDPMRYLGTRVPVVLHRVEGAAR